MWEPVDTGFFVPRVPVAIADIGGVGHSSAAARALLESLGAVVHLHLCGTPGDFLSVVGQGQDSAPYLILFGHGDDAGFVFGEYADFIDTSMLVKGIMTPQALDGRVYLPGCAVINTACFGGETAMAQAFLKGGAKVYIGTVAPNPDATADPLFLAHFLYKLIRTHCTVREAWQQAAAYDRDSRLYVLHDSEGCHRVE